MAVNASLDSIIFFVRDVERLKDFYTEIFQLPLAEHTPQMWALLKAGDISIGLHRMGEEYLAGTDDSFKADSNAKLVFEVEEEIHQLRTSFIQQGVAMREVKTFENYPWWLCDGEDPEGNVFQLKQKKQE